MSLLEAVPPSFRRVIVTTAFALAALAADVRSQRFSPTCPNGRQVTLDFLSGQRPVADYPDDAFAQSSAGRAEDSGDFQQSEDVCRVLFADHLPEVSFDETRPELFDYVLTSSLAWTGWLGRRKHVHFLDTASWRLADSLALARKTHTLSLLFPPVESWDAMTAAIYAEATALKQRCFIDDGESITHDEAFENFRFSWILDARNDSLHPAFVRALGHQTIPVFTGWVLLTNMFHNAVVRHQPKRGGVAELLWQLRMMVGNNEDYDFAQRHNMLMDILTYRYRVAFPERLTIAACHLCGATMSSLAVVGVYSARENLGKRSAIRMTWGRVLSHLGVLLRFFLGAEASDEDSADAQANEARVAEETSRFGDIVRLPCPEGYIHNACKGLAFMRYHSDHYPNVAFSIKVDDDVYWRPQELLRMLERRTPFRYVWGFLDLNSPVPREEGSPFFHSREDWPDDIFPSYPRGALRALSMDVVRLVAAKRDRLLSVAGDDPSLGVHLRQIVMQDGEFLQLDDRGASSRFAMTPSCRTNGVYNPLQNTTWLVHHAKATTMKCMFRVDLRGGVYRQWSDGAILPQKPYGYEDEKQEVERHFPSLCGCVDHRRRGRFGLSNVARARWLQRNRRRSQKQGHQAP